MNIKPTHIFIALFIFCVYFPTSMNAERAPDVAPIIDRKNWCVHGTPTRTTGECMCRWSSKYACVGPDCHFEYGLSWHHHTCLECQCVPKPWTEKGNMLREHMAKGIPSLHNNN